jgi:hypothetical protein
MQIRSTAAQSSIWRKSPTYRRIFVLKSGAIEKLYNWSQWSQFEKEHHFWSMHIDWESVARNLELSELIYKVDTKRRDG